LPPGLPHMKEIGYDCLQCACACSASLFPLGGPPVGVFLEIVMDPMSQRLAPYGVGQWPYFGKW
jgi:hypothetical protein